MALEKYLNQDTLIYLLVVIGVQILYSIYYRVKQVRIKKARRAQGLPDDIFLRYPEDSHQRKRDALIESCILLTTIFITPIILYALSSTKEKNGIVLIFFGLILWMVISGSEVAKSFLGGLAFKTYAAFNTPFKVGDWIHLKEVYGKVTDFDTFFVKLQKVNGEIVHFPTKDFWGKKFSTEKDINNHRMCTINFYLAPSIGSEQRQNAKDIIWDAIQSSVYFDATKPKQVYYIQKENFVQITAQAYVASVDDDKYFRSDVTRAFLDFASAHNIPLSSWQQNSYLGNKLEGRCD